METPSKMLDYLQEGLLQLTSWCHPLLPTSWILWIDVNHMIILQISLSVICFVLFVILMHKCFKSRGIEVEAVQKIMGLKGPRFRKRDKMLFYTKRIWRNVNTLAALQGGKRLKKRQVVLRLAKKILFPKRELPQLKVKGPSQAFLEEDSVEQREEAQLPSDVMYLIKSIRLFGFLEQPLFSELYRHIVTYDINEGDMLFDIGDEDDSLYTVISGRICVFMKEGEEEYTFKVATAGDSIASFLSALVVLGNRESSFKTVAARAQEPSKVVRLRYHKFHELLKDHPQSMLRLVQNVMIRLQRVDFCALHGYLGLTNQMMKTRAERARTFSVKMSPTKASSAPTRKTSHQPLPSSVPHTPIHHERVIDEQSILTSKDDSSAVSQDTPALKKQFALKQPTNRRASVIGVPEPQVDAPESECLEHAAKAFAKHLNLTSSDGILQKLTLRQYCIGDKITEQNDTCHENTLYFILSGIVEVRHCATKDMEKFDEMYLAHAGDLIGVFEILTSDVPFVTRVCKTRVKLACFRSEDVYEIFGDNPLSGLYLALDLIDRLSPFVRQIDFAMDWTQIESGRAIFHQHEPSNEMFVILSGRLRAVSQEDGRKRMVAEYGRGDLVGLVELLTEAPRDNTVMAVRDTELAKIPVGLVNVIKMKYPEVVSRLIQMIGNYYMASLQEKIDAKRDSIINRKTQSNFSTIAILPVTDDVPLRAFTLELNHALRGKSICLTSESMKEDLGANALDKSNEYRLCSYLGQLEDRHSILLYECDREFTPWTQRCVRQADCILIVALAEKGPQVGTLEVQAEVIAKRTQKELILLHREDGPPPQNTVEWLNIRSWCSSHHHLRCPKRVLKKTTNKRLRMLYEKLEPPNALDQSHFGRLARFLTGTSIGLVLGGGGARGCAHVGMIRAILEAGIPIDMVGGVSIGSFMSALYAQELNLTTITQKARDWAYQTVSYKQVFDITYPIVAYFTGRAFNYGIRSTFGDKLIEDLWLPYFTVTTDITSSCPRTHRSGSLWSYVRSSMSLAGVLPPLCDPIDGHLLLDGGYVNNLPADVMYREMGAQTIIAVDVGSQDETNLTNYGETLSGWWLLWKRSPLRYGESVRIPDSAEIQSRLAYVSCVRQLEEVKASGYSVYVRPPIDQYRTLQFNSFNEIMEVGYEHGRQFFDGWNSTSPDEAGSKEGKEKLLRLKTDLEVCKKFQTQQAILPFDDLAVRVCQVRRPMREEITEEEEYLSDLLDDTSHDEM